MACTLSIIVGQKYQRGSKAQACKMLLHSMAAPQRSIRSGDTATKYWVPNPNSWSGNIAISNLFCAAAIDTAEIAYVMYVRMNESH